MWVFFSKNYYDPKIQNRFTDNWPVLLLLLGLSDKLELIYSITIYLFIGKQVKTKYLAYSLPWHITLTNDTWSCRVSHRCWEHGGGRALQNLTGGFKSIHGGSVVGRLKMPSKNTCEGVHLIVKLPSIILQSCKFTKNKLLHTHFSRILARF